MLNKFRAKQIVDKDNTTKTELAPLGLNNNIYLTKESSAPVSSSSLFPINSYFFDEGAGSTVTDQASSFDMTLGGTYTWGSGYFEADFNNDAFYRTSSLWDKTTTKDFSVAVWVEFNQIITSAHNHYFASIGDHSTGWVALIGAEGGVLQSGVCSPRFVVGGGSGFSDTYASGIALTTGQKYLFIVSYKDNGGSGNIQHIRVTADGVTWYEGSNTNANNLDASITNRELFFNPGNGFSGNVKLYRTEVFPGELLTNDQAQDIFDRGSEYAQPNNDIANPTNTWGFNEGSGSTVTDLIGSSDMTIVGSPTWNVDNLQITGTGQDFSPANGFTDNLPNGSFSVAYWVEFTSPGGTSGNNSFLMMAGSENWVNENVFGGALLWYGQYMQSVGFNFAFVNGGTQTNIGSHAGVFPAVGQKTLVVITYTRNGGSNNNVGAVHWTQDGSTWHRDYVTNLGLMPTGVNTELHHRVYFSSWGDESNNFNAVKYYRTEVYPGTALTSEQTQTLWDNGSEADTVISGGSGNIDTITVSASVDSPATLMINNLLYSNTSNTSVLLSGDAGKRHIFAVANDVNKTFTLESILETDSDPVNSRFIGIVTWDGSQITSVDSSLSKLIETEYISINSSQNTVSLSEISYGDNDQPVIFVNGVRESNVTLMDSKTLTFTTNLDSGDYVGAVKIRNSASFSRPVISSSSLLTQNMTLWLDPSQGITTSGSDLSAWVSQDPNNLYTAVPFDGTNTFTSSASQLNNQPAIHFQSGGLKVPNFTMGKFTIFIVAEMDSTGIIMRHGSVYDSGGPTPGSGLWWFNFNAHAIQFDRSGSGGYNGASGYNYSSEPSTGTKHIFMMQYDTTHASHRVEIDGVEASLSTVYSGDVNPTDLTTDLYIMDFNNGGFNTSGYLGDVVIYSDYKNSTDLATITNTLKTKYGIS
jgi:hypothetical protein